MSKDTKKRKKMSLFQLLFFPNKAGIHEEEAVLSPGMTVLKTFKSNKIAMIALTIFIAIFLTVILGPVFLPVDLGFQDSTQIHIAPGLDLMDFPKNEEGNIAQISVGRSYSVAATKDGRILFWGKTQVSEKIDLRNIPEGMGHIVQVAAGLDHCVALNSEGKLFAWGVDRFKQSTVPRQVAQLKNIKKVLAGAQYTLVLTEDGQTFFFGNTLLADYNEFHPYQRQVVDIMLTSDYFGALLKSGVVVSLGFQDTAFSRPPAKGNVVQIASTSQTFAALDDEGKVYIWGNVTQKLSPENIPAHQGKIVSIAGGQNHMVAVTDQNEVLAWGNETYGVTNVPKSISNHKVTKVENGFYQNYAFTEDGKLITWGLKGYFCGTDELGRDLFLRLLNGGQKTMTIGAVSVIISVTIAIVVGGISGYFGGKIDIVLQRIAEMVSSLPFLPFAMILSTLIGTSLSPEQRVYMIMVILGLLSWPGLQRLIRAQVFSIREQEYVTAAKILGVGQLKIIFKHIIPNVISIIIVSATLSFAGSMLTESGLSFIGFGVVAPVPTWGNILNGAKNSTVIRLYWWRWVYASILLSACVICINLVGEGLRAAIDPKSQER
ncbi:MAG: ABC transporter permease subunit [Bacillota bacterium]|nr:ABC transporter permease subunit [Bacillota bacterium]